MRMKKLNCSFRSSLSAAPDPGISENVIAVEKWNCVIRQQDVGSADVTLLDGRVGTGVVERGRQITMMRTVDSSFPV